MMQLKDEHGYAYEPEMEPICLDRPATSIGVNKHGRACRTNCGCDDRCLASDGNARYRPSCGAEALDEDGAN